MPKRSTGEKIRIFRSLFSGQTEFYGTYSPSSGRARQIKEPVTDKVYLDHLIGKKPFGVYLLVGNKTKAVVADFDSGDRLKPLSFVQRSKHYGLSSYIEISRSKGYHCWIFFATPVHAFKARLVVRFILEEIEEPNVEVFPKQDELNDSVQYGSFINTPLFGLKVREGRTAFVDSTTFLPYGDQWSLLDSVVKNCESDLDEIMEINQLSVSEETQSARPNAGNCSGKDMKSKSFGLPPCAHAMLHKGVRDFQRVSCFRIAVHLKRLGLPFDSAVAVLETWAQKNRPVNRHIITKQEMTEQARYAFAKSYVGSGCETEAVRPFCSPECPLYKRRHGRFRMRSERQS